MTGERVKLETETPEATERVGSVLGALGYEVEGAGRHSGRFCKCNTCGRFDFEGSHKCAPQWDVAEAEFADDEHAYSRIRGGDPGEAAEAFAARYWEDGASDGETLDVVVRDGDDLRCYTVTCSWSIDYHARAGEVRRAG